MAGAGLSLNLGQRQKLSQTMTPALQQALKLLQLSNIQLDAVVQEALETNPLLFLDDVAPEAPIKVPQPVRRRLGAGYRPTPTAARLFGVAAGAGKSSPANPLRTTDGDIERLAPHRSLRDVLYEEVAFAFADQAKRDVAINLTGLLDEAGYLAADIADVAEGHGVSENVVTGILQRLQQLAPPGLFARDLAECLTLQLAGHGQLNPAMTAVLKNLFLLSEEGPAALATAAGVDTETLEKCLRQLRTLNPRPGAALADTEAPAIVPDLLIYPAEASERLNAEYAQTVGQWTIALNPVLMTRLSVDQESLESLRARMRQDADKAYLKEQAQDASWLIRAIEQRTATILKVGVEIFRRQLNFLDHGVGGLKPLTQKEIALATDVHESTVSRAARDKYAATPQGVFPLRFMFSARIGDLNGGSGHAAKAVRHRLRALINQEQSALSDDALTRLLRAEGYDVARRTVAKYREMLRITSSVERRRLGKR